MSVDEGPFGVGDDEVDHPSHYGGDNPYEAIRVIEAWECGFNLGNTLKYIRRRHDKDSYVKNLEKAKWYLEREIMCARDGRAGG